MKKVIFKIFLCLMVLTLSTTIGFSQAKTLPGKIERFDHNENESKKTTKSFTGGKKIIFYVEGTGLEIEAHSGNDVLIETDDYEAPPERAKGLKALYNTAEDNTGMGLQIDVSNGIMTVRKASNEDMEYHFKVPAGVAIEIEESGWDGEDFILKNIKGEIEIKGKGSDIHIEGTSGPIVANTTSGDITVIFNSIDQTKPTSISNTSGYIDVTLPGNTKADLVLKSISGEIYSDMDIKFENALDSGNMKRVGGRNLKGTINGGGVEISLKAISDDIYLRKK